MAIATLDGLFAGLRPPVPFKKVLSGTLVTGRPYSFWGSAGIPGAGAFDNTLNGVVLSSSSSMVNGQLPHTDPSSGNSYLAYLKGTALQPGTLLLLDRLWHNGGYTITSTGAQNSTTPTWPSRCPTSGTDDTPTTTGLGVMIALEVSAACGAAAPAPTISYTNQAGTSGRTAGLVRATENSPAAGAVYFFGLQAGDTGVRSVQSLTLGTSWVSGTINLVAYRVLGDVSLINAGAPNAIDALTGGGAREYNGVVPWLVFEPSTTTATGINGTYIESQG